LIKLKIIADIFLCLKKAVLCYLSFSPSISMLNYQDSRRAGGIAVIPLSDQ
jgi:hypothetical protein